MKNNNKFYTLNVAYNSGFHDVIGIYDDFNFAMTMKEAIDESIEEMQISYLSSSTGMKEILEKTDLYIASKSIVSVYIKEFELNKCKNPLT